MTGEQLFNKFCDIIQEYSLNDLKSTHLQLQNIGYVVDLISEANYSDRVCVSLPDHDIIISDKGKMFRIKVVKEASLKTIFKGEIDKL